MNVWLFLRVSSGAGGLRALHAEPHEENRCWRSHRVGPRDKNFIPGWPRCAAALLRLVCGGTPPELLLVCVALVVQVGALGRTVSERMVGKGGGALRGHCGAAR